jgi:hypothetical protein
MCSTMLTIGVRPTPPLSSTTGRVGCSARKKSPAGGVADSTSPTWIWSCRNREAAPRSSRLTEMR